MTSNKSRLLMITVCCLSAGISLAQQLTNVRPVTPEGEYSTPKWSPDGTKLLFTDEHNARLFLMEIEKGAPVEELASGHGIGYKAEWSPEGSSVIFKEKQKQLTETGSSLQIKKIDVKTKEITLEKKSGLENRRSAALGKIKNGAMLYINQNTLRLEMRQANDETATVITREEGQYYYPILSPNGEEVIVHDGNSIYLYSLYNDKPRKYLGAGLASCWMPDGSGIITFEDTSDDGHTISASELYIIDTGNATKKQLTFSNNIIEMWPDTSPDGKHLAFSDERSGRIFIADINR